MLIIHGTRDRNVPIAAAMEHHKLVPQSQIVVLDENHFMALMLSVLGSAGALLEQRTLGGNFQARRHRVAVPIPTDAWDPERRQRPLRLPEIAPPESTRGKYSQVGRTL
jgi:hypothetical protein